MSNPSTSPQGGPFDPSGPSTGFVIPTQRSDEPDLSGLTSPSTAEPQGEPGSVPAEPTSAAAEPATAAAEPTATAPPGAGSVALAAARRGRRRSLAGRPRALVLGIGGAAALLVFGLVWLVTKQFSAPAGPRAGVNQCLAGTSDKSLTRVDCTASNAAWKVLGKLDGVPAADINNDQLCSAYPRTERIFWEGPDAGRGYALCLEPIAK